MKKKNQETRADKVCSVLEKAEEMLSDMEKEYRKMVEANKIVKETLEALAALGIDAEKAQTFFLPDSLGNFG